MLRISTMMAVMIAAVFSLTQPILAVDKAPDFSDDFNRMEENDALEQPGKEWRTNSKSRAQGDKQADLKDGALVLTTSPKADHAVVLTHDMEMKDVKVELRFMLEKGNSFNLNFSDKNCKKSHAGHVCHATVNANSISIADQLEGVMKNEFHAKIKAPDADRKTLLKEIEKFNAKTKAEVTPGEWHTLVVEIKGDSMTASVDGKYKVTHKSSGFGHPTKTLFSVSAPKVVTIDDIKVWNLK